MDSRSNSASAVPSLPQFHPILLKLDRTNHAYWRALVLPTIRAHGFEEFISPTAMPPTPILRSPSGAPPRQNPDYAIWIRRDQFLMSWMLASIGESMLGHVVRCNTAHEVWSMLERLSFSQSKARIMQLRMSLQTTRKLSALVEEYFMKMRSIADQLAAAGQVVTDDVYSSWLWCGIRGAGGEFHAAEDSPTLQDAQLAFQAYEQRIAQHAFNLMDPSVNVAYYGGGRGSLRRSAGGSRGPPPKSIGFKAVICQLCGKAGHLALKCFKRFDVHFTGESSSSFSPQVFVADAAQECDEHAWYIDSGATNHITHDIGNLQLSSEYVGAETVMVGNGQGKSEGPTEG